MEQDEKPSESEVPEKEKEPVDLDNESLEWFNEDRLLQFATLLQRYPALWRCSHTGNVNKKSARGFAYTKLMDALSLDPVMLDADDRVSRGKALCRAFYRLLRQQCRSALAECRARHTALAQARALLPAWAAAADEYLRVLDGVPAKKKKPSRKSAAHKSAGSKKADDKNKSKVASPPSPPPSGASAGARALRRVVRLMRRAAASTGALNRAAAASVADGLGDTEDHVYSLWCSMRSLAMSKLRTLLSRGDVPPHNPASRLNARDWAVADLLLLYDCELLTDASFQNYDQLKALLNTFHLVQRFQLEPESSARDVPPEAWEAAARWYSRGRAIMSAVALQRRWHSLKQDTRWRLLRRLRGAAPPPPVLPLHQAVARRYEHVVTTPSPRSWRQLVAAGKVAKPTSPLGPCPGEPPEARLPPASDSSESDSSNVEAGDDDDIILVEKSVETIDLLEDEDEAKKNESAVKRRSRDMPDIEASSEETSRNGDEEKSSENVSEINKNSKEITNAPSPENVVDALQNLDTDNVETTILFESDEDNDCVDVTKDANTNKIVDVTVIESKLRQYLTQNTKSFLKSTGADISTNKKTAPLDSNQIKNLAAVISSTIMNKVNESNESRGKKAGKRQRIESSDSDVKLVIDDSGNSSNSDDTHSQVTEIEKEMIARGNSKLINSTRNSTSELCDDSSDSVDTVTSNHAQDKISKNPLLSKMIQSNVSKTKPKLTNAESQEKIDKNPLLSQMIQSKCIFDDREPLEVNIPKKTKVYENKKKGMNSSRYNRDTVSLANLIIASMSNVSEKEKDNSNTEVDDRRRSCDTEDAGSNNENTGDTERGIDPKLLMYPIVLLHRIEDDCSLKILPSPPKLPPHLRHYASSVTAGFLQYERNVEQLLRCRPCSVMLERMDTRRGAGSRVAKKVELPDIEEVRRNNRSMLTAQVAPLAQRQYELSSPEVTSSEEEWTPDADEQYARDYIRAVRRARRGERTPVETKTLKELLDELAGAESCGHDLSVTNGIESLPIDYDCRQCCARLLERPPTTPAEARVQSVLLKHTVPSETECRRKSVSGSLRPLTRKPVRRRRSRSPPPCPPGAPSPPDAERGAREWLRQKNIAAEKFGLKPRTSRPPPPAAATTEPLPSEPSLAQNKTVSRDIFNPGAVADINRRLGSLVERPPDGAEPFEPVITCVQSLAPRRTDPPATLTRAKPVCTSYLARSGDSNATRKIVVLQNRPRTENGDDASQESDATDARARNLNLPKVVDVAGNIRLPAKTSNDQIGLHLVVQNNQMVPNLTIPSPNINQSNIMPNQNVIISNDTLQTICKNQIVQIQPRQGSFVISQRPDLVFSSRPNSLVVDSGSNTILVGPATEPQMPTLVQRPTVSAAQNQIAVNSVTDASNAGVAASVTVTQAEPANTAVDTESTAAVDSESTAAVNSESTAPEDGAPGVGALGPLQPAFPSRSWVVGRDPTALAVLAAPPDPWLLSRRFVLLSEEQPPADDCRVWTLEPRVRLALPDEDSAADCKKRKVSSPEDSTEAKKAPWLRVKSFARIVEDQPEQTLAPALVAPPRVFLNDKVYQKLSNHPLIYAKLLVAVPDARSARQLLSRGAELQLYCLSTCRLFPLHAEPKGDMARITLSGSQAVSGALVALARQLYQLPEAKMPAKRSMVSPGKEVPIAAKPAVRIEARPYVRTQIVTEAATGATEATTQGLASKEAGTSEQATITPSPCPCPCPCPSPSPCPAARGSPRVLNHDVNAAELQTELRPQQTYRLLLGPQPPPPLVPRPPAPPKALPAIKVTPVTFRTRRKLQSAPVPKAGVIELSSDED